MMITLGRPHEFYQTWQATEELYFSQTEAKFIDLLGTKAIQSRKQIEKTKGLIKF